MKSFLEHVAEDIINKYGTDLSKITVIFPNKRTQLFLNELLALKADTPLWAPTYKTISELFCDNTDLVKGDPVKLVCEAYKSFVSCTGSEESLDRFYGWGQMLLSDFDDIDKNMADASHVLKNITDLHELDSMPYLTDEQKEALQRFFGNINIGDESELKKRFLTLWDKLEIIYKDLRFRLRSQGIAYEGMLYRDVVEKGKVDFVQDMYLFIGFNVLQKAEQELFEIFMNEGKARFYWDFDKSYMTSNNITGNSEAGQYIRENIRMFPNEFDSYNEDIYDNLSKTKKIRYVSASTESVQARYMHDWLKEKERYKYGKKTAIVMCDELMLPVAIHNFSQEVESINITTGYPLMQTAVATFVMQMIEMRNFGFSPSNGCFRQRYVLQILSHPYSTYISQNGDSLKRKIKDNKVYYPTSEVLSIDKNLTMLFTVPEDTEAMAVWIIKMLKLIAGRENDDPLYNESVFRMYTLCNRLLGLISSGDLTVDTITFQKLMSQLIATTTVPFHGEPAEGVQLMGILETRNLDFNHILILSCNEGKMPKGINDASFIPYAVRKAYGLTTPDNKVAIFAYYFYNLIQRATDVTLVYNNSTEGINTGEMSRFMLQLMVEQNFSIERISLKAGQKPAPIHKCDIEKDDKIMSALNSMDSLSPTAINRYMRCPLQFYYNNVAKIKESEDDEEEGMSNRIFGEIFHKAAEIIYKDIIGINRTVTASAIIGILKDKKQIRQIVDRAFVAIIFNGNENTVKRFRYNGLQLINREVIIRYVQRLLEIDKDLTPFKIMNVETSVYEKFVIATSTGRKTINIGGWIDRMDQINDVNRGNQRIRIIDYKTGGGRPQKVTDVRDIFKRPVERQKHTDYLLQTMLYSIIVSQDKEINERCLAVSPALLFIQHTLEDNYDPTISIGKNRVCDIAEYATEFKEKLLEIVSEIFEPTIAFRPTDDINLCANCPYKRLCEV